MKEASLGPLARTILFLVGVTAVAATTLLWQYLYGSDVETVRSLVGITPTAVGGVVTLYYAIRG